MDLIWAYTDSNSRISKICLKSGRPKDTWRKTVEEQPKMKDIGVCIFKTLFSRRREGI
jgi:hypothetical protein